MSSRSRALLTLACTLQTDETRRHIEFTSSLSRTRVALTSRCICFVQRAAINCRRFRNDNLNLPLRESSSFARWSHDGRHQWWAISKRNSIQSPLESNRPFHSIITSFDSRRVWFDTDSIQIISDFIKTRDSVKKFCDLLHDTWNHFHHHSSIVPSM